MIKKILVLSLCAVGLVIPSIATHAADDNHGWSFRLLGNYNNSHSGDQYRETKSYNNPWKVNLAYNEEGDGYIETFWLATGNYDYAQASGWDNVSQGSGDHYYNSWNNGLETDVCLSAENNNDTWKTYDVSGYWDEETW